MLSYTKRVDILVTRHLCRKDRNKCLLRSIVLVTSVRQERDCFLHVNGIIILLLDNRR